MDKKTWGIVIVIVVIILIALFAFSGGDKEPSDISGDDSESFSGSLQGLLARGKNVTCTFESVSEGGTVGGTVYIAGDRVRGDYTMAMGGTESFNTSSIMDGEFVYTWGETPAGVMATKIAVTESETEVESVDSTATVPTPDQNFEYDCDRWSVDEAKFTPPSDVEFQDLSAMFDQVMEDAPGTPQVDCSVCDTIPEGEQKTQCLEALGC